MTSTANKTPTHSCTIILSHVMKWLLVLCAVAAVLGPVLSGESSAEQAVIERLQEQLQSLQPDFIHHFIDFYHLPEHRSQAGSTLNISRVTLKQSAYLLIVAKMYLYNFLPNHDLSALRNYNTPSNYLAAYYYLRIAAEHYENPEAYYMLAVLEHYKLVPDKLLQANIENAAHTPNQQTLLKYLQQSHLYNAESSLFMSSALSFQPASLVLAYMNRNRLGTSKNCTTALAYYLSVVRDTYVDSFSFRQVYHIHDSLEDQLYSRKKLPLPRGDGEHHFIEHTEYFDDETIQATIQLADSYYMGSHGHLRNLTRAARLYEKLAASGSRHGKVMAGICSFKGEGVPADRSKAKKYFLETSKDEISEYMLIAFKYYEILEAGSKQKALQAMLERYKSTKGKSKERLGSHLNYLIGAAIVKGELKEKGKDGKQVVIPEAEGYQLLDNAAAQGNTMAKVLLGVLFADGANGLKYGCEQATKYFAEEALVFPFFVERVSTAQAALNKGWLAFSLVKYMELTLVGYENAYINLLYLLQVYGDSVLNMKSQSWSVAAFKQNLIYKELRGYGLADVESYILKLYSIKGKPVLNFNNLEHFLQPRGGVFKEYHSYIRRKVIRWGSVLDKKNILKYYEYRLTEEERGNSIPLLTSLASGDSSKLYVSEARYLLGKYHHHRALENKSSLTPHEHFRILGEYNRAVKSELLGLIIFHIEEYLLGKDLSFDFFQSDLGEDMLAFVFVVSLAAFALYYLRSKRIDHFHRSELEKQLRKAAEERQLQRQAEEQQSAEAAQKEGEAAEAEQGQRDPNQPIIVEDEPRGIRIGSSVQEEG